MASITAIELGVDSCALARTSVRHGEVQVHAAETLDPAAFPGVDSFTLGVRHSRQALKLPRRARAVVWGLPEGSTKKDAVVKPFLAPLIDAGFRIERVVSPCDALAALARIRAPRGEGATCWLAINRGGVAIVVVRPGTQLYAHSFAWNSNVGASGSQARLLQRYSLVSFLSPQIKRAMAEARKLGTTVDAVVTCGNLPDLRSLTMPLIEDLDVEVETLDSLDGLLVKPPVSDKLAEAAPAIRLACAGLLARGPRSADASKRGTARRATALLRTAALIAVCAALGFGWFEWRRPRVSASHVTRTAPAKGVPVASAPSGKPVVPGDLPAPPSAKLQPVAPASKPAVPPSAAPVTRAVPAVVTPANPPAAPPVEPQVVASPAAKPPLAAASPVQPPAVAAPPVKPPIGAVPPGKPPAVATPGPPRVTAGPVAKPPIGAVPSGKAPEVPPPGQPRATVAPVTKPPIAAAPPVKPAVAAPAEKPQPVVPGALPPRSVGTRMSPPATRIPTAAAPASTPAVGPPPPRRVIAAPVAADKPGAGTVEARRPPPKAPMPALLKDPMPRVTAILVASDRRFATVNEGQLIGIGDVLGRRVVVGIDEQAVVLREPSGVQIRVGLGGRILGVERGR